MMMMMILTIKICNRNGTLRARLAVITARPLLLLVMVSSKLPESSAATNSTNSSLDSVPSEDLS